MGGQSGEGERPTSDAPHNGGRHPPRGRPSATPIASNAGPQGRTLWNRCWVPTPAPTAPGTHGSRYPGCPPQRTGGRGRDSARHQTPLQQWRATPPRARPPTTPAASSPHRACRPSQVGRNQDQTAPHRARRTEQGTGAEHAERHGPRRKALPVPSAGTARGAHATPPRRGGGSGRRGSAGAHTHKGHAGTTRRATGRSSRNAQAAWNGVPASECKGHPDGTARHTQRGTRGAGRGKWERHNTRYRPEPPEPAGSAVHTQTGHCTSQGSSGALRHDPTPRQGSLRASSRGSHWRQASGTGLAAPAPRATTH